MASVRPREHRLGFVTKLNYEIDEAIAGPDLNKRLLDLGNVPRKMTPGRFGKCMEDEFESGTKALVGLDCDNRLLETRCGGPHSRQRRQLHQGAVLSDCRNRG